MKVSFKNTGNVKKLSGIYTAGGIHHWQTWTTRIRWEKKKRIRWKENDASGYLDLHKEIKGTGNGKYEDKYAFFFRIV